MSSKLGHCKEHQDAPVLEDRKAGDLICSACGLVIQDRAIDDGPEWRRLFIAGPDQSRVGGSENPLLDGSDLTTIIGGGQGKAAFNEFGVAKYQTKQCVSSVADRALLNAFKDISQMGLRMNFPRSIIDRAKNLCNMAYNKGKVMKGRSYAAVASGCLYIACRQEGVPRTFKEICAVSTTPKKEIVKCFNLILKALDISVDEINTGDFMSRFCSNLGLPNSVEMAANAIAREAVDLDIVSGSAAISIASAAIYMASQLSEKKRSHKEIADVTGVSDVTIRKLYKLMYPRADELFPKEFQFVTPIDQLPLS